MPRLYRVGGPALQVFDAETGIVVEERWCERQSVMEFRSSLDLPAIIQRCAETRTVTKEMYFDEGGNGRENGKPAEIHRDPYTGMVTKEIYRVNGMEHRDEDRPAIIEYDPETGKVKREEYYFEWELHREGGPAIIEFDKLCNPIEESLQFFERGKRVFCNGGSAPGCLDEPH